MSSKSSGTLSFFLRPDGSADEVFRLTFFNDEELLSVSASNLEEEEVMEEEENEESIGLCNEKCILEDVFAVVRVDDERVASREGLGNEKRFCEDLNTIVVCE